MHKNRKKNSPDPMVVRGRIAAGMLLVMAVGLTVRLYTLSTGEALQQAAAAQQTYVMEAARIRGTIYDRNLRPITNGSMQQLTAAVASPAAVTAIRQNLSGAEQEAVLARLESGKPALFSGALPEEVLGAVTITVPERYGEDFCAAHIIGYTDTGGQGVCGIELDYDHLLNTGTSVQVRYRADAWGRTLNGEALEAEQTGPEGTAGVVLTIDRDIQQMAESVASESLTAGAIVILESATGKIRAMVSMPDYDPTQVEKALNAEDSPLLNRALCAYNVGSVFKLVSACCAAETGQTDRVLDCTGTLMYHDRTFQCIFARAHGQVGLSEAVALSCNGYFILLAEQLGATAIYRMAQRLGFGQEIVLSETIRSEAGTLPDLQDLSAPAALANFSFGQGELMATPLQVAGMIQIIANNGLRKEPTLIEGTVDSSGGFTPAAAVGRTRVLTEETAAAVRQMMIQAVTEGTAAPAAPAQGGAGAKTATAETGWVQNGEAVVQAWCAGFYPADTAEYTIVVFAENGRSGSGACAPIFRQLAEGLEQLAE